MPNALEWAKILAPLLTPFIALLGAIFLYFKKARDDRQDGARQRRAHLYEEYIDAISRVLSEPGDRSIVEVSRSVALALAPVHTKISLLAPLHIVDESHEYLKTLISIEGTSFQKRPSQISDHVETLAHLEKNRQLGNARQKIVNAFRQDVFPSSAPLPSAMIVLEGPEHSILTHYTHEIVRATKEMQK